MTIRTLLAAIALAAWASACAPAPEARIKGACVRDGNTAQVCDCFVANLRTNLTPEQMEILADSSGQQQQQSSEAQQQMQQQLGMDGAMSIMQAAKTCGMTPGAPQ